MKKKVYDPIKEEKNKYLELIGTKGELKIIKTFYYGDKIITLYEKNGVRFGVRI